MPLLVRATDLISGRLFSQIPLIKYSHQLKWLGSFR